MTTKYTTARDIRELARIARRAEIARCDDTIERLDIIIARAQAELDAEKASQTAQEPRSATRKLLEDIAAAPSPKARRSASQEAAQKAEMRAEWWDRQPESMVDWRNRILKMLDDGMTDLTTKVRS